MQVSSVQNGINPYSGSFSLSAQRETFQSSNILSMSLSGSGDSLIITKESFTAYEKTTLNISGKLIDPASETDGASALLDRAVQSYLEIIRDRVAYLLEQATGVATDAQDAESGDDSHNALAALLNGQISRTSLNTYDVQTLEIAGLSPDWSPEATADRIASFALSFYDGGDRAAYVEEVRGAVMKGFNDALAALGSLPGESYQTIDLVNKALDDFAAGGQSIDVSA